MIGGIKMNWKIKVIKEGLDTFLNRIELGKVSYLLNGPNPKTFFLGLLGRKLELAFSENPFRCGNQEFVLFLRKENKITEFFEFKLLDGITIIPSKHIIQLMVGECHVEQVINMVENSIKLSVNFKCFMPNELNNPATLKFNAFAKAALEFMPHSIHPLVGNLSRIISEPEIQSQFDENLIKNLLDYITE